ncbi:MAG TPA: tetratricopeptide repeat protein, partial [Longimicrobiales bacterium]
MHLRVAVAMIVWVFGGCSCAQAEDDAPPANEIVELSEDLDVGTLPAVLAAAGRNAGELAGATQFKRALQLLRAGDGRAARSGFEQAARMAPGLADWSLYFAAHSAASYGDTVLTAQRLEQLDADFRRTYGWRALSLAHEKAGTAVRALAVARQAAANITGTRRFDAGVEVARLLVAQGDTARGLALFMTALDSASTPTRIKAASMVAKLATTSDHWLRIGRAQRTAGLYADALASFQKAGTDEARLERAQVLFLQRKYLLASGELSEAVGGATPIAGDALLLRARADLRLGNRPRAVTGLKAAFNHSNASMLTKAGAAYMLGDLAQDAGNVTEARSWFRAAIITMPASEPAALSYMRLGIDYFVTQNYAHAAATFEEFAQAHAKSNFAQQALFWSARAHDRANDKMKARELMREVIARDQFSYYGLSAGNWLGLPQHLLSNGPTTPAAVQEQARGALRRQD